jgi:CheY-like chemotaxis protein
LTFVLLVAAPADLSWAQNPKPKADEPVANSPAKAATAAKTAKTNAEEPAMPEDPAAAAILETKPSTPAECVRAAKILSDLKQPELAKKFLQKVIEAKLDEKALATLADEFGSAMFVQLSARSDLHPQSQQLADAVLAAQNAVLQNPQRVAELIKQLQDPSAEKRGEAFSGLMDARGAAVSAMIEALADPGRAAQRLSIRTALVAMGRQAADPLVGILDQADAELKLQAVAILGEMKAPVVQLFLFQPYFSEKSDAKLRAAAGEALKKLGGALPTKDQAVRLLMENAKKYFNHRQIIPGVVDDKAEVWYWNDAKRQCVAERIPVDDASRALAARLAREAYEIAPENAAAVQLYLATMLEAVAYQNGLPNPLKDNDAAVSEGKRLGPKTVEAAMAFAMSEGHPAAATAAAQIFNQIGNAEELLYGGPKPGALALALQNPDRRLRIAAARAIVLLKPKRPFAGSSYVLQTLEFFASSSGMRQVLLAGANVEDLRKMVPALTAAGYQTDTATNGREAMRMAVSSPDYELALIDAGIDQPPLNLLLQQLRHDDRSADLRVGVIARDGFSERAQHAAEHDPLTKAFARPHDDASVAWQLEQLAAVKPDEFVTFEERQRQAGEALDLLGELARNPGKLYDMHQAEKAVLTALNTPSLCKKAIEILISINSPEAQRALVETAGRVTQPLEIRQAAVSAFRQNLQAHGILLNNEEIKKQYQQYNESKNQDESTRNIMGLILDCLEAPTKTGK